MNFIKHITIPGLIVPNLTKNGHKRDCENEFFNSPGGECQDFSPQAGDNFLIIIKEQLKQICKVKRSLQSLIKGNQAFKKFSDC